MASEKRKSSNSPTRLYTYQWPDGTMSLVAAKDEASAFDAIDEVGQFEDHRLKPYCGREFSVNFGMDNATGRFVMTGQDGECFYNLLDDFGMLLDFNDAVCEDVHEGTKFTAEYFESEYERVLKEADALARQHIKDNLPVTVRMMIADSNPRLTEIRTQFTALKNVLSMTLSQFKQKCKESGIDPKSANAVTQEEKDRGDKIIREEMNDLKIEFRHLTTVDGWKTEDDQLNPFDDDEVFESLEWKPK